MSKTELESDGMTTGIKKIFQAIEKVDRIDSSSIKKRSINNRNMTKTKSNMKQKLITDLF